MSYIGWKPASTIGVWFTLWSWEQVERINDQLQGNGFVSGWRDPSRYPCSMCFYHPIGSSVGERIKRLLKEDPDTVAGEMMVELIGSEPAALSERVRL